MNIAGLKLGFFLVLGTALGAAFFGALEWNVRLYCGSAQSRLAAPDSRAAPARRRRRIGRGRQIRRGSSALRCGRAPVGEGLRGSRKSFGDRGGAMSRSPLEVAVVFHIGPVIITGPVVTTWVLIAALAIACRLATRHLRVVPDRLQAMLETLVTEIEEQVRGIVNHDPSEFLPMLGTLFIFLVVANLSGTSARDARTHRFDRNSGGADCDRLFFGARFRREASRTRWLSQGLSETEPDAPAAKHTFWNSPARSP